MLKNCCLGLGADINSTLLYQERSSRKKLEDYKEQSTAQKMFQYGVFPSPYFPVFSPNTGKYGPEKTSCLETFRAVKGNHHFPISGY